MRGNRKLLITLIVIIIGLGTIFMSNLKDVIKNYNNDGIKVILIDPGHGGMDGGASSKDGTPEKNINLNISLLLADKLRDKGYKVFLTRDEDVGLYTDASKTVREKKIEDLNKRVQLKKESNCDIFVSIHLNTFPQESCKGAQVWYSNCIGSQELANIVQDTLKNDLDQSNNRKAKPANNDYKVLRGNDTMPGIIVECGFLTNYKEAEKLKNEEYQKRIAESIGKGISIYLEN